jgi:phospholipid/cholesterol/gamma-HCH transport system substrate-binding protein
MENRSHAMLAGLFTLFLLICAALAAIWISKKNVPLKPFELVASSPVTGLSVQSQVRYQGVPVGRVESLRFIRDKPGQVRILIGVDPNTPVTEGTWAEIVTAGVTGISNIELRDNGTTPTRLESSAQNLADIPIKPSFLERLQARGGGMLASLERVLSQVEKITSDDNLQSISTTLNHSAELSASLSRSLQAMEPGLKKLPVMMDALLATGKRVDVAAAEIGKLAISAQDTVKTLNAPNGPMQTAANSLIGLQDLAMQMRASTLPDVSALTLSLADAARSFNRTSREIGQAPQSLIFGPPPAVAGPGEPGFAGFGSLSR